MLYGHKDATHEDWQDTLSELEASVAELSGEARDEAEAVLAAARAGYARWKARWRWLPRMPVGPKSKYHGMPCLLSSLIWTQAIGSVVAWAIGSLL